MKTLRTRRKRDASDTIRGYVYQVDLTIQRWLELPSDVVLELERGEDIDTIQDAMQKRGGVQTRLLEQIKARKRGLTLRSAAALEALASFCEHEQVNPNLNLNYRYVTNAKIGVERPSPAPDRTPLVNLWNGLGKQPYTGKNQWPDLKLLREFLAAAPKPIDLNSKTWKTFVAFVKRSSYQAFHSFVRKVEWLANQTPTDLVAGQIKETLVTGYATTPDTAQTVYSVLFLHVFKLLSQSGIKRLTPADRDAILASPIVEERDRALLLNLSTYFTDLTARVGLLEADVASLKNRPLPNVDEIQEACSSATRRLAQGIIAGQSVIQRESFQPETKAFFSSQAHYCFLLGPSGVGKSTSIAMEALRLSREGRIVLLIPGKYFSLEEATKLITEELSRPFTHLSWQNVINALTNGSTDSSFVLFIDAIDEADNPDQISKQLTKLHDSIGAVPAKRVQVFISCRDIAWGRFRQQRLTPLYQARSQTSSRGTELSTERDVIEIHLRDFTTHELDHALREIGATELLEAGRFGESPSAHISTLRDLLRHPATFEHYSALKRSNSALSTQEITWSDLVEARLRFALEKSVRQCGVSVEILRSALVKLAILGWQAGAQSFDFDADVARAALPKRNESKAEGRLTPLESLVENRVLNESVVLSQHKLSFQISDIGAYLLSEELERQINRLDSSDIGTRLEEWLSQSWNFQPLLDAMLALADRFFEEPYSSRSLAMVKVIVESHRFHDGLIFGLMRPEVLKTIFEIVSLSDENDFYGYRDAALEVRPFHGVLQEIRSHLKDENRLTRRLAAELAGAHQDEISVAKLIQLLRDEDDDVRERVYKAFGLIGRPAVSPLVQTITDSRTPVELRTNCLYALQNIGLLNREISRVLKKILKKGESNRALLRGGLLTAAHLRDRGHAKFSIGALKDEDHRIVQAAAKYLTEVPTPAAYPALRDALSPPRSSANKSRHHAWNLSQLMMALLKANKVKARKELKGLFGFALAGHHELSPNEAIRLSEKFDLPDLQPLILARLVEQIRLGPKGKFVWESARVLGATWRIDQLDYLIKATQELERHGTDLAKLVVDAIVPGIQECEEFRLGDRLNRTSDLLPVVKAQSANFGIEAARLLRHSGFLSCIDLSRWLWVAGDTRAEAALIHRFENPTSTREAEARHERCYVVRALSTCGDKKGAQVIIDYLRNRGEEVDIDFAQQTLYPVLTRNMIDFHELIKIARDPKMNWWSRSVSLVALGRTSAPDLPDLFADVAESAVDQPRLQPQAVRSLALTKHVSVVPKLRRFLRNSRNRAAKEEAAKCLAWLKDDSSVHEIERALEDHPAPGFASALSDFGQESSLPILLRRLASANPEAKSPYLKALGAFWKYPRGRTAILEHFDKWSSYEERFLNNQSALIAGLSLHEPDVILDQFNKSFDDGHLTTAARETMVLWMGRLFNRRTANENLLLETAKRLLCDKHFPAKEMTVHTLRYSRKSFCSNLFRQLHDSPKANEWERACAVYALGFWNCSLTLIKDARFDSELLVRRAGDEALAIRSKREQLTKHMKTFEFESGQQRLSSYLCLLEQGDQTTIWEMSDEGRMIGIAQAFRKQLSGGIRSRLTAEYKKRHDEEKNLDESRGTIWFD